MRQLFGNLKMTWLKVIIFAVITGVYTGVVMLFPALENTSVQDIGISFEWWVLFAVIVVVNCEKSWEAALKCFVFFLISQPLVYLVKVIFGSLPLNMALYYYLDIWLPRTLLTLPGGFIAYFCKKQNVIGAIILGLGNTIQAVMAVDYFGRAIQSFPHHLLSGIFCIVSIIAMSIGIQKENRNRLLAILIPIILTALLLVLLKMTGRVLF